ncbi:hypothetical protein B0H14DRAFT_2897205 [Mycena olivaceomarginata]|nr:hypothetical protein B0H14DRAFT_2897205 [Mycena olivaceomarginata]
MELRWLESPGQRIFLGNRLCSFHNLTSQFPISFHRRRGRKLVQLFIQYQVLREKSRCAAALEISPFSGSNIDSIRARPLCGKRTKPVSSLSRSAYKFDGGSCRRKPLMSMDSVFEARLLPSTLLSCATILIYDWICTLDREITHVWSRPLSTGTLLFALNRYSPFIDVFVVISTKFQQFPPEQCLTRNTIFAWLSVLGVFLSEVILVLRTWAFWDRRRTLLIWLIILTTCTLVATIVTTQLELKSLHYIPTTGVGCTLAKAGSIIIFAYLSIIILETTIVVLTAVKAYRVLRHSRQPWLVQLYRDGMLFYIYLLMISLANILVPILAPSMLSNWFSSPQRVLHSVLCTRVLLCIRAPPSHHTPFLVSVSAGAGFAESQDTTSTVSLQFAH